MSGSGHARTVARAPAAALARGLTPAEAAWVGAVPCTLAMVALMLVLGGPLGRLLAPGHAPHFFPPLRYLVRPEPTEHARYLLALLGPLLVAAVAIRRAAIGRVVPGSIRAAVWASQALAVGLVLAGLVAQHVLTFSPYGEPPFHVTYFTWPTVAVAAALAALLVAALRRDALVAAVGTRVRETPRRRTAAYAVAALATATWLLTAINSDGSIANANRAVFDNVAFWFDETFALLNGHAPLVTFHAQYSQLWPYVTGGLMSIAGTSLGVYTVTMASIGGLALLAVFDLLRRVVRSSLLALALYLPFLATGFFTERGPLDNRYGPVNAFSMFPLRYAGPYLLAWLTVRHVTRPGARGRALLLVAGGLVALNNPEFGVPALGATLAALVWSGGARGRDLARLLGEAALGLLGAAVLVSLLTLAVAGSLPHFGLLTEFPRLYGLDGFGMLRMPALGFHLAVYATFAAAIVVATVRALGEDDDRLLTAMLVWAGVFGLGAGSYYAGRSHPEVLIDLFSAWALALVLLSVAVVRAVRARGARRPALAELAVLLGLGLAVCSLAQTPTPWSQVRRLERRSPTPAFIHNATERFIASATRPGEAVVILTEAGHRIAYDLGVDNLAPYANAEAIPTREQLADTIRILRDHGGRKLFIVSGDPADEERRHMLAASGFRFVGVEPRSEVAEFVARG